MSGRLAGKTFLVLGAGGFIGINLCLALEREGAAVLRQGRASKFANPPQPGQWMGGDLADKDAMRAAVDQATHVVHLIGSNNPAANNSCPRNEVEGSLLPSLDLFELCAEIGVEKLVFVSSGGTVYGPSAPAPTPETAATNPISAYGAGKVAVEKFLAVYCRHRGLSACTLRVANPYGPWQDPARGQGFVATAVEAGLHGSVLQLWGDGSVVRDFVFIADVAEAIIRAALYRGDEAVFNIGSGKGRSLTNVIESVGELLARSLEVVRHPARPADVPVSQLDIGLAARELGWQPDTDWSDGLRLTLEWMQSFGSPAGSE